MKVELTEEERKQLVEGKPMAEILADRPDDFVDPGEVKAEAMSELDQIKADLKQANVDYKAAIQKNKDLYDQLAESRKEKEACRNKISELRQKKKELMGKV